MNLSRFRFLFVLASLVLPLAVQAAPHYAYTAVGLTPEKGGAYGLSNSGNVTGRVFSGGQQTQAFLYSHNNFIELGTLPGDSDGIGRGVNNSGQVVGESGRRAFLYSAGQMIDLGSLANSEAGAYAINDAGHVVGWSTVGGQFHAFLYRDGVMRDLGTLPGARYSYATAINNRGQVTGVAEHMPADPITGTTEHAFLYENGVMKDLGSLGGPLSQAFGINDFGHVVGMSYIIPGNTDVHHAFLYSSGVLRDLGTPTAGTSSWANGINNLGQVVGWYSEGTGRAFIYDKRKGMRDLGRMVDPASGWYIHAAYQINDRGQIAALGCKNGQYGAVLLNPTKHDGLQATPADDKAIPQAAEGAPENPPCPYG